MATNKIIYSGETLIDLTSDTITEETLVEGYTAHNRSGEIITGTLSEATEEKKGLMSASDKIKLNGIATGAEVNVQSDWNATSGDAFIKNKPTVVTSVKVGSTSYSPSSGVVSLPAYPTIPGVATTSANGLMSKTDKSNLDTIVNSFNNDDSNTTIDTIKEVLKAFENAPEGTNIANALSNKVDKVSGKGLSTNDFTNSYKTKLDGIVSGAEVNVQSDWNVTDTTSDAYIKNKPTIPTVNNGQLTIQKNGTNVATFTANQSGNATANITVPTKVSELTNDSGFTTNTGTVTSVKVGTTSYSPSSGVVSLPAYPSNYLPLAGGTMTGAIVTRENAMALKFRTHASSYEGGIVYGTTGNEALTIAMQNPVTAFQIVYGTKPSAYGSSTWQSVTPLFQTKDGKVIINRKIAATSETSNLKLLDVNGEMAATTIYEGGTSLSSKYLGISSKAADSSKLNGQEASYYLNYNNLSNKPTIPTNTWRGIQDNLTSTSTTDSLSANQGKILNEKFASYLPLTGGTITAGNTLILGATSNANSSKLKWGTVNSKTPYFGYASDQTDGTFVWSITGTTYQTGLAIGGGSGNLLWKGVKVATVNDIPSGVATQTWVNSAIASAITTAINSSY